MIVRCSARVVCVLAVASIGAALLGITIAGGDNSRAPALGLPPAEHGIADSETSVELGRLLFETKVLSSDGTVACATCHVPALGFSGPDPVAVGIGGIRGARHPPPLLNLYWEKQFMLDGRAPSLDAQVRIPLESRTEMDVSWPVALKRLEADPTVAAAGAAPLTRDIVLNALAAYVRSLISGGSPFDRYYYLGDQSAISEQAKDGLELFVRKGRCSSCHLITGYSAPLTDSSFHSVGIGFADGAYRDPGRFDVTGLEQDLGVFKTPTLRDVSLRRYFMHDGSMTSLKEVVDYYNRGGNRGAPNLDGRIRPLYLTESEEDSIIAFLSTLTAPIRSTR